MQQHKGTNSSLSRTKYSKQLQGHKGKAKSLLEAGSRPKREERKSIVEIEVNIDEEMVERCVIYEGDTVEDVANKLAKKHKLTEGEKKTIKKQLRIYL